MEPCFVTKYAAFLPGAKINDDDARKPIEIKWYNDSYLEIPVLKKGTN